MEENIGKILEIAGNHGRYQIFLTVLFLMMWLNFTIFSFSLGFLENPELVSYYDADKNQTVSESLSYDICDWESNYTVVETYKYSWVIDLGIQCEKLKVSLIGTFTSLGLLLGAFTYSVFVKKFGEKKVILIFTVCHMVLLVLSMVVKNYYVYCISCCLASLSCNIISYSTMIIMSELIEKSKKSIHSTIINSGLGLGGIFYVLMFIAFKNWKKVFGVSLGLSTALFVVTFFTTEDSFLHLANTKQHKKILEHYRLIAKFNGRLKEFEENFQRPEYQNAWKILKGEAFQSLPTNTPKTMMNTPSVELAETPKIVPEVPNRPTTENNAITTEENLNEKPHIENKSTKASNLIDGSTHHEKSPKVSVPETPIVANIPKEFEKEKPSKATATHKEYKHNIITILKYSSIRCTFLTFCLLWFVTSALYSGLTIGLKNLPGSIYVNSLLLFIAETPAYYVAGFLMNSKLGRKYSLMLSTGCFSIGCLLLFILYNYNTPSVVVYLLTRFFVMASFGTYYSFCLESYPLSIGQLAYGINGGCNSFGGMVIPFIVEYISGRTLYLIYTICAGCCTLLILVLKETKGVPIPDEIKEIVEEEKKNLPSQEIPVVVV